MSRLGERQLSQVHVQFLPVLSQFIRFGLVGGVATAIHYFILYALHGRLGWNGLLAPTLGLGSSAAFNFTANYYFTFRAEIPILESFWRFVVVTSVGLLLNAAIFWLLVSQLSWFYLAGQATATIALLLWNFLFSRSFTYASDSGTVDPKRC